MSKLSKRAIPILLIATMLIALIPVFPATALIILDDLTITDSDGNPTTSGQYGDTIIVKATSGITAGEELRICWDGLKAWDGERGILNSTTAKGSGGFEVWFDVPEATAGDHWIWFKDMETGDTLKHDIAFEVKPKIDFSPSSGLVDDKITLYGYGFDAEDDIVTITFADAYGPKALTTTPLEPESDELGSWECTFKVPHDVYSDWQVSATDDSGIGNIARNAVADFTIGSSITLDTIEGPVGTVVEIEGRGFNEGYEFDGNEVTIELETPAESHVCTITDDDIVGSDGEFKIEVVIPQTDKVSDKYKIKVLEIEPSDPEKTAKADFEVTGLAEIKVTPQFGVQGTTVSIEGWNFTQMSGETIEIWLYEDDGINYVAMITDDFDTESNGEFTGTFTIPAESSEKYKIKAIMDDYKIEAETSFRIGLMIVIPSPSSGPTGTKVTLTGTGFTYPGEWNATFGDIAIVEDDDGDVDDDSDLLLDTKVPTFYVPTTDPGTYTISVYDIESEITVDVEWTVTATTMVEFDPLGAPNEYNVSITGSYFNAEADGDLEFVLYNVTSDGEADYEDTIDVQTNIKDDDPIATVLDKNGNFTGWWKVFDDETLSIGEYTLNVTTDVGNIMAQAHFSVIEKSIDVRTRKSSFQRGETLAFDIWSTFTQHNSYIEIYDYTGDLYWTTDMMTDGGVSV